MKGRSLFCWAISIFTSRSFSSTSIAPHDTKYWATYKQTTLTGARQTVLLDMSRTPAVDLDFSVLFPGMDAGNHDVASEALWTFDPGRFSLALQQPIDADSQICNNYGPKSNGELLQGYGFAIEDNPNDTILLTLKAPPLNLQNEMRATHAGFFDSRGHWLSDKATFGLKCAHHLEDDPQAVFAVFPDVLLDLLILIVRDQQGFRFEPIALDELNLRESRWYRYLPHIAQILLSALQSKGAALAALGEPLPLQNAKQVYAKTYRQGQVRICRSLTDGLTRYLQCAESMAAGLAVRSATLADILAVMQATNPSAHASFLQGLQINASSSDMDALREAGWEDDIWILLLCYYSLINAKDDFAKWLAQSMQAYRDSSRDALDSYNSEHEVQSILDLARVASEAMPHSPWSDDSFGATLVLIAGRVFCNESFYLSSAPANNRKLAVRWYIA